MQRQRRDPIAFLDGTPVFEDIHLEPGQPGHYKRYSVVCPLCASSHPGCGKRRNIGPSQTKMFGPKEPLAYLGCWIRASMLFENKDGHLAHRPSKEEVKAFMAEHGWL